MDSPRGRIYLMKAGARGAGRDDAVVRAAFRRCLGCMACVTACPSGVQYGPLIERTRAQIERHYPRPAGDRLFRRAADRAAAVSRAHAAGAAAAGAAGRRWCAPCSAPIAATVPAQGLLRAAARRRWRVAPPVVAGRRCSRSMPEHDAGAWAATRMKVGDADRLRAAPGVPARQRRDVQRAGRRRLRGDRAGRAGLLRRAAAARRATSTQARALARRTSRSSSRPASIASSSTPPAAGRR